MTDVYVVKIDVIYHLTLSAAAGFSCTNGELHLEGGNSQYDGRVEVCVDNKFTTVCNDGTWGPPEAQIVCRQLNFTTDGGT